MTAPSSPFIALDDPRPSRQARRLVRRACESWPATRVEDAELIVAELVGNAFRHGRGTVSLRVSADDHALQVAVADDGDTCPVLPDQPASVDAESGRGLHIVEALADTWGTTVEPTTMTKTVWFTLHRSER